MSGVFSNFQKSVWKSFSCLLSSFVSIHLLRAALFTHYARTEALWSRRSAQGYNFTSPLCCWRLQSSSPRCIACQVFVTKRIVPVLGSDCTQRNTCERITFDLNINLPTENFHSYWYSPLCLVDIENLTLLRNNDIQDFLNMHALSAPPLCQNEESLTGWVFYRP